jgi:alkylhydroperoxidase family enzyme
MAGETLSSPAGRVGSFPGVAQTMGATTEWVRNEELAELERLGQAQYDAAKAGNLQEVRSLLGTRQRLLASFRGRAVHPELLRRLVASDAETMTALTAEISRVETHLARLRHGERALAGYVMQVVAPPGFLDQVR